MSSENPGAVGSQVERAVRRPVPKRTEHGFAFGAAEVSADAADDRGYAFIGVKTKRARISVHVTPSGLLRVWMNGMQVLTTR
jgi:hypothetical protein